MLFLDVFFNFLVGSNSNSTYKTVQEGISSEKKKNLPQIAKNADNSNLESKSVVEDFDSIFQKM